ncbi:transcriptional regulator [Echinicola strongylocentroti]|uniref:Transcriptional regulator n=1 Tax=Echinicola strongylocentroti TaxID=1795355 RepID=A0A2Z4IIA5_9BACT|nr:metalloregulator ArsR/SmtB family transcription factor [Echinicola strongylocentroti]AWW30684.1 transcriptional regulator [Echinicola strongylocentroti]
MSAIIDPFKAIADPNRRAMLIILSQGSHTISSLSRNFDMSRPAVSKHLKLLHAAGLIHVHRKGREKYCHLNGKGFDDLKKWMGYFDGFWLNRQKELVTSKK